MTKGSALIVLGAVLAAFVGAWALYASGIADLSRAFLALATWLVALAAGVFMAGTFPRKAPPSDTAGGWIEGSSGLPVRATPGGKLYAQIQKACPDCGSADGYYRGPEGGISVNIFCTNPECRSGFNITPIIGTAERIGKCRFPFPGDPPADKQ